MITSGLTDEGASANSGDPGDEFRLTRKADMGNVTADLPLLRATAQ